MTILLVFLISGLIAGVLGLVLGFWAGQRYQVKRRS